MSYYIKRIITIDKESSHEKLSLLNDIFTERTGFGLKIFDDHLDDSNWNAGSGISAFICENEWADISEKFGQIAFTVHCVDEKGAIYDYYCNDGNVEECTWRETPEWYKMYEDKSLRAAGARKGYYDDPGPGPDYEILYGGIESVPAGYKDIFEI